MPVIADGERSAWAQFAIRTPWRDGLKAHLQSQDIPSVVYYEKPLHLQPAYSCLPAVAERARHV